MILVTFHSGVEWDFIDYAFYDTTLITHDVSIT